VNDSRAHDGVRGQQREREADETVRAHVQQDPPDHRGPRGSFRVRIGEPGVEWEHRNLDGKREEEAPEEPTPSVDRKSRGRRPQRRNIEGARPASRHRRVEYSARIASR